MPYKNTEERRAYFRARYANDPIFKEKALARAKKRRLVNKAGCNSYKRKWRQRDYAKVKDHDWAASYQKTHRAYYNSKTSLWRARVKTTTTEFVDYAIILERAQNICGICHEILVDPVDIDHIIPLSKGGTHTYDNLQATHASCNRRKWNKLDFVLDEAGRR